MSLVSSVVIAFSLHWDHPGWLGSFLCDLGVAGFILCPLVCAQEVVGFIRGHWVHTGVHCGSLGTFGVVRLTRVHPGGHEGSLGSLGCALWIVEFIGVVGFTRVRLGCRCVHLWSLGTHECVLGVVGFMRRHWVHSGAP